MSNISPDAQKRLIAFDKEFETLADKYGLDASYLVLVPSVTIPGYVSFQSGGHHQVNSLLDAAVREYNEARKTTIRGTHSPSTRSRK